MALQLLLRYPSPEPPHGPHTFVDDAIYLKGHMNPAGGSALILKYTGRAPTSMPAMSGPRPSTPTSLGLNLRQRTLGARSPLSTPAKFLQTPGGVEAIFQGAAKGVIERGEKLGINQAVRDAVGEIRRNVQGLQEARSAARSSSPRDPFVDQVHRPTSFAVAVLERRDRQLAAMLDETVTNLRDMASSRLEGDKDKYIEAIEVAAAKMQFVKVHLEDSSLALPEEDLPAMNALTISSPKDTRVPTVALDTTPVVMTSSAVDTVRSTLSSPDSMIQDGPYSPAPSKEAASRALGSLPVVQESSAAEHATEDADRMDTDIPEPQPHPSKSQVQPDQVSNKPPPAPPITSNPPIPTPSTSITTKPLPTIKPVPQRPQPPVPTRSTIAQSSFSWMLEPDTTTTSASSPLSAVHGPKSPTTNGAQGHKKRPSASSRRNNKNAFLFGEVVSSESEGEGGRVRAGEIFGLKTMSK